MPDASVRREPETPAGRSQLPLAHFAAVVESSDDAILTKDRNAVITSWNPAAEQIYGYTAEQAIGQPVSILIPPNRAGEEREILDQVLTGARVGHYETERMTSDGRILRVSLSVSPLRDEEGEIVGASVVARDITDRRRSLELAESLQSLTSALAKEITPERAIEVLLEQAVAAMEAEAGAVGLLDPSGTAVELAGSIGYSEEGLAPWSRFDLELDTPMSKSIRTGEPIWTRSPAELRTRFEAMAEEPVRYASLAMVPLSVEGMTRGALSLSFGSPRAFDPPEQAFLLAVAQQAANTLERARLYENQRLASERLSFLAEASEVLAGSLDPDAALRKLADLAVHRIAEWCGVELIDEQGTLRSVAVAHVDPAQVRLAEDLRSRYPVDPDSPTGVPNVIRTGQSEFYPEIPDELLVESAVDEEHLRLIRQLGLGSAMIVPLAVRGRVFGAVSFVAAEPNTFGETDLELAEDLARRAALAIDNSMLFRREHEAAVTLQRSLLPEALPEVEGLRFAARYEPAAPGLEVGGDWYEVVPRSDGTVGVMIGDVAGRGVRAASVMGRVRPALRAYVSDGHGPSGAVERLDELIKDSDNPEMTTLFLLQFDPPTGTGEYVRAGHPPALLRLPDGSVTELSGTGTPPLGILIEVEYRAHAVEVPRGSLLLLYTDGLIERRGDDLRSGLERLKRAFAEVPDDPEECLHSLASTFSADEIPDDVAMLAMAVDQQGSR